MSESQNKQRFENTAPIPTTLNTVRNLNNVGLDNYKSKGYDDGAMCL
ncbi:MAG: hypothetical protein ACMG6E_05555 [Candidatus Roizmanbacteria bacterium]